MTIGWIFMIVVAGFIFGECADRGRDDCHRKCAPSSYGRNPQAYESHFESL